VKFLTVDPGEDTGWSVWNDTELQDAGTNKMWDFSDALWAAALTASLAGPGWVGQLPDELQEVAEALDGIELIVTENWTLYPWEAMKGNLNWDECRTARLIGSIYAVCRLTGWEYVQQPAKIKQRAIAAGAEAHFFHPLRENRHQNDAIMHGVFFNAKRAEAAWTDLTSTKIEVP
jgi:hypothetical protein